MTRKKSETARNVLVAAAITLLPAIVTAEPPKGKPKTVTTPSHAIRHQTGPQPGGANETTPAPPGKPSATRPENAADKPMMDGHSDMRSGASLAQ